MGTILLSVETQAIKSGILSMILQCMKGKKRLTSKAPILIYFSMPKKIYADIFSLVLFSFLF